MPKNRDVQKNLDFFAGPTPSPGLRCLLYSLTSSLSSSKALGKQPTHHPSGAFEQPELNRQPGVTVRFSLTFSFGWVDGPSPFMLSPPTSNSKGAWWTWRYFAALKKASECLMPQKSQIFEADLKKSANASEGTAPSSASFSTSNFVTVEDGQQVACWRRDACWTLKQLSAWLRSVHNSLQGAVLRRHLLESGSNESHVMTSDLMGLTTSIKQLQSAPLRLHSCSPACPAIQRATLSKTSTRRS